MYIASASSIVQLHSFPENQLVHTYRPACKIEGSCRSLSWTKDGRWFAVVPYSGCVEIVLLKGQCSRLQTIHDVSEPSCANFQNLTKRNVAVGTKHGQVLLYDVKSRSIKARYPRTSSAITHVGFTAKDTHCYAGCASGDVLLFNNVAKNLSCTLKVPKSHSLTDVRAHVQRRNFLIGGSNEGIVCVWDVNVNKIKFQTEAHSAPVTSTIFSPSNSALIVSAGLDRVVRVFDIENRSRITSILVDNNVLSLDFLENSLYIAAGAQNGKIHIYDTRTLHDPVHTFESHTSAVKHLAYQKSLDETAGSNSSLCNMAGEESLNKSSKSHEEVQANKKRTSDFFGLVAQGPSSVSETFDSSKQPHLALMEADDSFLRALQVGNNTADSVPDIQVEVDNKPSMYETSRKSSVNIQTPNPSRTIHDKLGLYDSKSRGQVTSTPNFVSKTVLSEISPMITASPIQGRNSPTLRENTKPSELENAIKCLVEGELKKALDKMETKIIYQGMTDAFRLRRMVLDLHMASLKEFMKIEDYFVMIKDEVNSEPVSVRESYLLEENINLKKRVQELETELANLRAGDNNGNG